MRIAAAFAIATVVVATVSAQSPKSAFITTTDGIKIHYFELGGSGTPVNPVYTTTLVKFIDAHDK